MSSATRRANTLDNVYPSVRAKQLPHLLILWKNQVNQKTTGVLLLLFHKVQIDVFNLYKIWQLHSIREESALKGPHNMHVHWQ